LTKTIARVLPTNTRGAFSGYETRYPSSHWIDSTSAISCRIHSYSGRPDSALLVNAFNPQSFIPSVHGQSRSVHCLIQISHRELTKYEIFALYYVHAIEISPCGASHFATSALLSRGIPHRATHQAWPRPHPRHAHGQEPPPRATHSPSGHMVANGESRR